MCYLSVKFSSFDVIKNWNDQVWFLTYVSNLKGQKLDLHRQLKHLYTYCTQIRNDQVPGACLQGIMVFVLIKTNTQSNMMQLTWLQSLRACLIVGIGQPLF